MMITKTDLAKETKAELLERVINQLDYINALMAEKKVIYEEIGQLRSTVNSVQIQLRKAKIDIAHLAKDSACYFELCQLLNSELLSARTEISRFRYDVIHMPDRPETPQKEAQVPTRPLVTYKP